MFSSNSVFVALGEAPSAVSASVAPEQSVPTAPV